MNKNRGSLETRFLLDPGILEILIPGFSRKTWFRAALTSAILLPCARGGKKWLILGSKSGLNGRVTGINLVTL